MSIAKFQKITPEKALEQFQLLTQIDINARIADMACLSLDMRFKNPLIKQRIKRIKDDCSFIQRELKNDKKYGFSVKDTEYVEDATGELYQLMQLAVQFGKEGIQALNENLLEQINNAKEQRTNQVGEVA